MVKLTIFVLALLALAGCNNNNDVPEIDTSVPTDVYFAMSTEVSDEGWFDFISIEINAEDIVTNVELNGISQTVMATRRDLALLAFYDEDDEYPNKFYEEANDLQLVLIGLERSEIVSILRAAYADDVVSFPTANFADLAEMAINAGPIEIGDYIDGWYQGIGDTNEGYRHFVNLFIQHGNIISVHWNAVNDEGFLKYDPTTIANEEITEWVTQVRFVEQALIARQDPTLFSFDEDGFSTDIPNVDIEVETFVSLATRALAAGPLVREPRD
ncbi:MAG: hypothetical protein FWE07_03730 [Turicibacter sp.]|nr:hypothetical protein [Turicibacter sp.]